MLGSILGPPYFGKLPYGSFQEIIVPYLPVVDCNPIFKDPPKTDHAV